VNSQQQGHWRQIWSDEFDGTSVDRSKWQYEENCNVQNLELQCYTSRSQNSRVQNGTLTIIAKQEQYGNKAYTSARLNTARTASWLYGRFEMSAKLPRGKHLWPAFWMLPTDNKYGIWAASGEIDIMEYRGQVTNTVQGTLHFGAQWPNNIEQGSGPYGFPIDFSSGFHTFAVEWERDEIRWYVDSTMYSRLSLVRSFFSGRGANPYNDLRQPFEQRFHFVINMAVGGSFFNSYGTLAPLEAAAWADSTFQIDYIRAYQWVAPTLPTVASNVVLASTPPSSRTTQSSSITSSTSSTPNSSVINNTSVSSTGLVQPSAHADARPNESETVSSSSSSSYNETSLAQLLNMDASSIHNEAIQRSDQHIMGIPLGVVVGVSSGLGVFIVVIVVLVVVWFRRKRTLKNDTVNLAELSIAAQTTSSEDPDLPELITQTHVET